MFRSLIVWSLLSLCFQVGGYQVNENIPEELPQDEFFHFVTRPDILVPRWNVTFYNKELLSPGYWFTAFYEELGPMATTKLYIGPQIYDDNGELVWSSTDMFHNADTFDFRIANMNGKDQITFISLYAQSAVILDEHYEVVKQFPIGKFGRAANMHDFNIVDNGTRALVLHRNITLASPAQSKTVDFKGRCQVSSHSIEESDTTNPDEWNKLFTWHMLDHISLNESNSKRGDINNQCHHAWDFLHANAIDKCPDGNLVLSTRNTDTIYKISRTDGSIMWRLGGNMSDFTKDFQFSRQHHVRCHEANDTHTVITFLDNAVGEDAPTNLYSRGLYVSLDTVAMEAEVLAEYPHPFKEIQGARGSCEILDTGNVLMGWSDRSLLSEHTADGQIIMSAQILPSWVRSYRSYKFPFVGRPMNTPDVVSQVQANGDSDGPVTTQVYVSWNGATDVKYWNLYKSDTSGDTTLLVASVPRNGFETQLVYEGFANYVIVEALDWNGTVLDYGRSAVVKTYTPDNFDQLEDFVQAKTKETEWLQGVEFEKGHPWLSQVRERASSSWGMFAAGFLLSAGLLSGLWLALRVLPKKASWWKQSPSSYEAVEDAESQDEEKSVLVFERERDGQSGESSSSQEESTWKLTSPRESLEDT